MDRRGALAEICAGGALLAASAHASAPSPIAKDGASPIGWFEVKADFGATGDGKSDDTAALQRAINTGANAQRPVLVQPGVYRITQPLKVPSNTMLIGSEPGLGFGCRVEPVGCPAFVIGGKLQSFHCSIENLMVWPQGPAPDFIVSIDNSYSITIKNLRIHEAQYGLKRAAVLLLGDAAAGGHGRCNNIIWNNLIVRNDVGQPHVAVLAAPGCGTHRFLVPCLENYGILIDWQGGQLDLIAPYTERAGRYAINCNIADGEEIVYFNTFGGSIDCADSAVACAIQGNTRNFNSFGTLWGASADRAAYVYGLPTGPVHFYGITPNMTQSGKARFSGVAGWRERTHFPPATLRTDLPLEFSIPARGVAERLIAVPDVQVGQFWARVTANADIRGTVLSAFVSKPGVVTLVAENITDRIVQLNAKFTIECGAA